MIVGYHSPMPPARTGVADYSGALVGYLKEHCDIRLNEDGGVNLYHLGNNQLHAPIYRKALEVPGVVVLHDAVLHHFALGHFSQTEYIDEFIYNYGDWNRGLAEKLWQQRARSAADPVYFQYAMLKRLAERSRAIVVHNPAAARMVREHHETANVFEIPHLWIPHGLPRPADSEKFRRTLGAGLKFGIFGYLRESKRVLPILRVFARTKDATLLIAGNMASAELRRACEPYYGLPNVHRIGYMAPADYWTAAHAIDACLNLRFPAAGETSGISIGMMGGGQPVVMTDSEENSRYPAGACVKLSSGLAEEAELEALIEWCQTHRSQLREIGAAGQEYVRDVHAGEKAAAEYARVLALN